MSSIQCLTLAASDCRAEHGTAALDNLLAAWGRPLPHSGPAMLLKMGHKRMCEACLGPLTSHELEARHDCVVLYTSVQPDQTPLTL